MQGSGAGETAHAEDLALVASFAKGDAKAIAELEARVGSELAGALSRIGLTRVEIDEVGQIVRERLFVAKAGGDANVGGAGRPKILDYAGRGSLAAWLRAVIVRAGIDLRRKRARTPDAPSTDDEPLLTLSAACEDPEIETLRARYAQPFRQALADAVRSLPADERNALRLNLVEGLNIEQIGSLYGVHRATIARWISRAKETIEEETRRLLLERLQLAPSDLDSLVRLCRSRVDIGASLWGGPSVV